MSNRGRRGSSMASNLVFPRRCAVCGREETENGPKLFSSRYTVNSDNIASLRAFFKNPLLLEGKLCNTCYRDHHQNTSQLSKTRHIVVMPSRIPPPFLRGMMDPALLSSALNAVAVSMQPQMPPTQTQDISAALLSNRRPSECSPLASPREPFPALSVDISSTPSSQHSTSAGASPRRPSLCIGGASNSSSPTFPEPLSTPSAFTRRGSASTPTSLVPSRRPLGRAPSPPDSAAGLSLTPIAPQDWALTPMRDPSVFRPTPIPTLEPMLVLEPRHFEPTAKRMKTDDSSSPPRPPISLPPPPPPEPQ